MMADKGNSTQLLMKSPIPSNKCIKFSVSAGLNRKLKKTDNLELTQSAFGVNGKQQRAALIFYLSECLFSIREHISSLKVHHFMESNKKLQLQVISPF